MKRLSKDIEIGEKRLSLSKKRIKGYYVPHFHEFFEIEYVVHGVGEYYVNGETFNCSDGMLFFMTPLDHHSVLTEGADVFNIMFSDELVPFQQLKPFLQYAAPKSFLIDTKNRPFLEHLFGELVEHKNDAQYCAALMSCLLLKLMRLLPGTKNAQLNNAAYKIHFYIYNHFQEKLTLNEVAAYAGLTPNYASALFKKEMKIGFKAYLNSLRLEYAKKLLLYTELTIKQICEESGFEDEPNFFKRFKAYHGTTPTQLRKQKMTSKE